MNFIIKSTACQRGKRPIHCWTLLSLLTAFGVEKRYDRVSGRYFMFSKRFRRSLWDIWELVRSRWKQLRLQLHPDRSGRGYEPFAVMSAIHDAILDRLERKGIKA